MSDLIAKIQSLVEENKSLKASEVVQKNTITELEKKYKETIGVNGICGMQLIKIQELKDELSNLKSKQGHNDTILRARMKKMGVNYDHFKEIFEVADTVMAGGLITQIMTGDNWQTDIDIFTTNPEEVINVLSKAFADWISEPRLLSQSEYTKSEYKNLTIYQGKYSKNVTVDIIECRTISSAIRDFDLEFVKCYFDGKNFHTHNEKAVITKTHQGETNADILRKDKYEMRGFDIIPELVRSTGNQEKSLESDNITAEKLADLRENAYPTLGESPRACSRPNCPLHK